LLIKLPKKCYNHDIRLEIMNCIKYKLIFLAIMFFGVFGWTKSSGADTITAASCSQADVQAAINSAATGDTVLIPAGNCTWGSTSAQVVVNKGITLQGSGKDSTVITVGLGTWSALSIKSSNANIKNFTMKTDINTTNNADFISVASAAEQWTISGMKFDQTDKKLGTGTGYIFDLTSKRSNTTNTYGVIYNNEIMFDGEQVNFRGPCDSWNIAHSMGGAQNLFVEGNTFTKRPGGSIGYWDNNANSRAVFRYNTFNGVYIDAHGSWSNYELCSPDTHPSARHVEIYNNAWDGDVGWTTMYIRGGTGLLYNNAVTNNTHGRIQLDEYYVRSGKLNSPKWPYYPSACACDADYPVIFQVGRGLNIDPTPTTGSDQASEPIFIWNNAKDLAPVTIDNNPYGGPSAACKTYCNDTTLTVADFISENREYYTRAPQTGDWIYPYAPYTCPHPLTGLTDTCDSSIVGVAGYNVNAADTMPPSPPSGLVIE